MGITVSVRLKCLVSPESETIFQLAAEGAAEVRVCGRVPRPEAEYASHLSGELSYGWLRVVQ